MTAFRLRLLLLVGLLAVQNAQSQEAQPAKDDYKQYGIPDPTLMEGTTPAQWRILWIDDARTTATVSWSTKSESAKNVVHFDTVAREGKTADYANHLEAAKNGRYSASSNYYHHARLTKLTPGATYYFVLESDGKTSRELNFKTAPAEDVPVGILFGSDSRGGGGRINVIRMFLNFHRVATLVETNSTLLCFAFGGDFVREGTSFSEWDQWMSDFELTTSKSGRVLPLLPARGNHEATGPLYDEIFEGAGEPAKNWYSTQVGPKIGIITLNSQADGEGEQLEFLKERLPALHKQNRWLIAQYHVPLYPSVKYKPAPAFKPKWLEVFDACDLDLGVESDGHTLKRTHLMRGDKIDPAGTLYIGDGPYGAPPRKPEPQPYHAFTKYEKAFFYAAQFGLTNMSYQAINIDNQIVDSFSLKARPR